MKSRTRRPSPVRAWLQLLRPPNLFTVPGDPFTGYVLGNSGILQWTVIPAILASLFLYAAGLIMNDLADQAEDARERPNRPLPSGAVRPAAAWAATIVLLAAGLTAAWFTESKVSFYCAVGLAVAISLYNFGTRRLPVIGALNMGLCRGLSVAVGGFAGFVATLPMYHRFPAMSVLGFALLGTLYIAAVTNLARHETRPSVPARDRMLPAIVMGLGAIVGIWWSWMHPTRVPAAGLFLIAAGMAGYYAALMFQQPAPPLPPLIGQHIRLLLVLQAAACFRVDPLDGMTEAIVLLALWPLSKQVSRRFYAS